MTHATCKTNKQTRHTTRRTQSVRGGGDAFYRFVVPLIQYGTDVNSPQALYLLEDSLELWAEVLKQAAGITDGLLQIFPNLHTTLMSNFDHVKVPTISVTVGIGPSSPGLTH